jgi:hypothetical protein
MRFVNSCSGIVLLVLIAVTISSTQEARAEDTSASQMLNEVRNELRQLREDIASQKAEAAIQEKSKDSEKEIWYKPLTYKPASIVALLAVIVSLLSSGFALYQFKTNREDQEKARREAQSAKKKELLFNALRWFEGGTQSRSIGIAVIKTYWEDKDSEDFRRVWISLLIDQATHIMKRSKGQDSQTESANLDHIIGLLKDTSLSDDQRKSLCKLFNDANLIKQDGKKESKTKTGIFVEEKKNSDWKKDFRCASQSEQSTSNTK